MWHLTRATLSFLRLAQSYSLRLAAIRVPPRAIAFSTAAFAGVSGGFSANLLLSATDPMLGELTIAAASIIDPAYAEGMNIAMNYYFIIVSVFVLTIAGAFVTEKIVEPRLGEYKGEFREKLTGLSAEEKKGMLWAAISFLISAAAFAMLIVPDNGALRAEDGGIVQSPFMSSLVPIITILFFIPGLFYGIATKNIKNDKDVASHLTDTMASMGMFIVLAFTAGQFVAYFAESNMGMVIGVYGAEFLESANLTGIPLILGFIFITGVINHFFQNPEVNFQAAITAITLLVVVGALAGLVPALKAARIMPIEAMRAD